MADSKSNGRLDVFTIIEKEGDQKDIFLRVGTAWTNRDDSLNVFLDAVPLGGKLHIRKPFSPKGKNAAADG